MKKINALPQIYENVKLYLSIIQLRVNMPSRASVHIEKSTFYELFNQENKLDLPLFQRDYSWEDEDELDKFWEDIEKTIQKQGSTAKQNAEHFIGQIVLGKFEPTIRPNNLLLRNFYNIIDGQQRITTATIFLCALRDIAIQTRNLDIAKSIEKYITTVEETPSFDDHFILSLGYLDKEFFKKYVQLEYNDPRRKKDQDFKREQNEDRIRESNRKIYDAYNFFIDKLTKKLLNATSSEKPNIITRLQNCFLRNFFFIIITMPNIAEGSEIFETLNARGERLQAIDLVKNLVFMKRQSQGVTPSQLESELIDWNESVAKLGDINPSRFLRHYWLSKYKDTYTEGDTTETHEIPITIENLYSAFCQKADSMAGFTKQLLSDIREYSDIYVILHDPSAYVAFDRREDTKKRVESSLNGLSAMNASRAFPLLMSTYKNYPQGFPKICRLIEILVFKYSLICNMDAKKLEGKINQLSMSLEDTAKSNPAGTNLVFESALVELKSFIQSDIQFRTSFKYKSSWTSSAARYVLTEIEKSYGTGETLLNSEELQLEHIFPKSPSEDCKKEVGEEELPLILPKINSIGNFTLLLGKWNQTLSNRPFSIKKGKYAKSEMEITCTLSKESSWDSARVDKRNSLFLEKCLKIWDQSIC